jgi:PIN domain nuclease of toxin-antitoxin system
MQRLLLDTHVLLWWLTDDARLGSKTRKIIEDERNEIFVSAATTWEVSIKKSLGKIRGPDDLDGIVEDEGFSKLPISLYHGQAAGGLPYHHRDPFDRMLVAQAQAEGLSLITADPHIPLYGVRTLHAEI